MENRTTRMINLSNTEDITPYNYSEWISSGYKWQPFGKDNDYPEYLRNLYLTSPTHQSIIDGTTNLATGEGVEVVDPAKNPISNKWVLDNLPKDVIKSLISDLKLYGYCALQIYSGSIVKYSSAIKYRYGIKNEQDKIDCVWYSNDWERYTYKNNRPVKLPLYTEGSTEPLSILICQLELHGFQYYSPVDYNAGINYINLEAEISKYHLSNIKNGLFPSFLINFVGAEFSDEQMDKIEQGINKKFGGSTNTGRAIIGFSSSKDNATTLETIGQPDLPAQYEFLSKESSEKILLAHGVSSPLLFGIRDTGGGLGSNSAELENAFYIYYESKLKHLQNYILQMIKIIMNGNLLYADVQFKTSNPFKNLVTANGKAATTLSKVDKTEKLSEVDTQFILNKIDKIAVKTDDTLISEYLFDGKVKDGHLYRFVKCGKNHDFISKKFELLDNKGFLFEGDELIKNSRNYFFKELKFLKKTK